MKTNLSLAELLKGTDTSLRMALILEEVRVLDSSDLDDKKALMASKIKEITEAIKGEADLVFTPGFEYFMDSLHNLLLNCDNRSVAEPGRKGKSGILYQKVIDTPEYQIVHTIQKNSYKDKSEVYAQNLVGPARMEEIESEKLITKVYGVINKDTITKQKEPADIVTHGHVIVEDDIIGSLDSLISGMNQ